MNERTTDWADAFAYFFHRPGFFLYLPRAPARSLFVRDQKHASV
jgi:hypothetical protein